MRGAGGALRSTPLDPINGGSPEKDAFNGADPPRSGRQEDEDIPF
jgi:hypothetical protein